MTAAEIVMIAAVVCLVAPYVAAIAGRGGIVNGLVWLTGALLLTAAFTLDPRVGRDDPVTHEAKRPDDCRADQYDGNEALCRIWGYEPPELRDVAAR